MPQTILLIDDSQTVQTAAKMVFSKDPEFKLVTLNGLDQAKENARVLGVSLLMIDSGLPAPGAFEFAASLKADPATSQIPIVLLVGMGTRIDPQEAMAKGIAGTITKPFTSKEFIDGIVGVLSGHKETPKPTLQQPQTIQAMPPPPQPPALPSMLVPPPAPRPDQLTPTGALSRETIEATTRKMIEEVVWEVVPELAEKIIREELKRLIGSS